MLLSLVLMFGVCLFFYKKFDDDFHDGIKTLISVCLYVSSILFLFVLVAILIGSFIGANYISTLF